MSSLASPHAPPRRRMNMLAASKMLGISEHSLLKMAVLGRVNAVVLPMDRLEFEADSVEALARAWGLLGTAPAPSAGTEVAPCV